jgi:hypothetical protein
LSLQQDTGPYNQEGKRYKPLQHGRQEILALTQQGRQKDTGPYNRILVLTTEKVRDTSPYNMEGKRHGSLHNKEGEEILVLTTGFWSLQQRR